MADSANNFGENRTILFARNACFQIARDLGYTYFMELDDDYSSIRYRWVDEKYTCKATRSLDYYFDVHLKFYKSINALSVAFAQGGDFIGGEGCGLIQNYRRNSRKCMNSFICSTEREFNFVGTMNDDVNTYCILGSRGNLFLTLPFLGVEQAPTQMNKAGLTDMYLKFGTYCKSFTTVIMQPSSVKVSMMGCTNMRLHHRVSWPNTTPMIISEKHRKS